MLRVGLYSSRRDGHGGRGATFVAYSNEKKGTRRRRRKRTRTRRSRTTSAGVGGDTVYVEEVRRPRRARTRGY